MLCVPVFGPLALVLLLPVQDSAAHGEELLVEYRCVACHAAPDGAVERLPLLPAPVLDEVGARVKRSWLLQHLDAPASRTESRMPDLLAGLSDDERARTQVELVNFLAARGGPFETQSAPADPVLLERGRQLYHSVGCVACHAPFEVPEDLTAPLWSFDGGLLEGAEAEPLGERSLDHLITKTGHEALAAFLRDPLHVRPGGEMPSLSLTEAEARAIARYLTNAEVRVDGSGFGFAPKLVAEYFEDDDPSRLDGKTPTRTFLADDIRELPEHRPDRFGLRYQGFVEVPEDGRWRFFTRSDDGSFLSIDGELVVNNGGTHPPVDKSGELQLEAGRHSIEITFFEQGGGEELAVSWSGPGVAKETIPPHALSHWVRAGDTEPVRDEDVDLLRATAGAAAFDRLRCGACHAIAGHGQVQPALPLADLDANSSAGCLGDAPGNGVPRYAFDGADRAALTAALEALDRLAKPLNAEERLTRTLRRKDCFACHQRRGVGGPDEALGQYFLVEGDLDLGDEGRLPPTLDHVGWKLRPDALSEVLSGEGGVRPYMRTRMPVFGDANVGHLSELLTTLDSRDVEEPLFDKRAVELGRQLAGLDALGCIQCHDLAGYRGLGIPAADLAQVHDRVSYGWFRELLLDPQAVGMNSRMPFFFADGVSPAVDVYGGDPARQVEALWTWLSLEASVPLPDGLSVEESAYELVPFDRVMTVGVFFKDVSPRTMLVGYPERVHCAFDVENSRLAAIWKGRFFNSEGTWHGRAGRLEQAMGEDVFTLPEGVSFASLDLDGDWPTRRGRELGYAPLGRLIAPNGQPTFRYDIGDVIVDEEAFPTIEESGVAFVRRFRFDRGTSTDPLIFRAAVGQTIKQVGDGDYLVDGQVSIRLPNARVHTGPAGMELRALVTPDQDTLEVELRW